MKKLILTILLILSFFFSTQAGEWSTDFNRWGKGVIMPTKLLEMYPGYQHFQFPQGVDIPVYGSANGAVIGTLTIPVSKEDSESPRGYFAAVGSTQKNSINDKDIRRIGYEFSALIFFEEKDGYYRVLNHSLEDQVWIKIKNLEAYGMEAIGWMKFILTHNNPYHPSDAFGMNLRTSPEVKDNRITTMKGDLYFIRSTGKTKGLWAEVKVERYDIHPCEGDNKTLNSWTGWIKLLDNSGYPNIWFYPSGC